MAEEDKRLCIECHKDSAGRIRCDRCRKANTEAQKRRQQKKREMGLCIKCARQPKAEGHSYCGVCLEKVNSYTRNFRARRKNAGRCAICGEPCEQSRCDKCRPKHNKEIRDRRHAWIAEGKCRGCGASECLLITRSLRGKDRSNNCRNCYEKVLANTTLGSCSKWPILLAKLDRCGWRCPYTGEELVLGDNLSFDHIFPVSRFPEKRFDPDNVEPISWQANLMKRNMTKDEFLAIVRMIAANIGQ